MSIGIYIHVPFCERKCAYCDFYSVTDKTLMSDYVKAVVRNIKTYDNVNFDSVYFGGGTPSLLKAADIAAIVEAIAPEKGAEITLECNPKSGTALHDYKTAGINRLSVGIQSLDDSVLHTLGRLHDRAEALHALEAAFEAGFENVSADLMLGVPGQTLSGIETDIETLTAFPIKHISAYMLKLEPGTPLYNADKSIFPDEDSVCDFYLNTVESLSRHGLEIYEISNFAVPGFESRHNLKYWNCEEYIGIGPAAHSYYGGLRFAVKPDLKAFISAGTQPVYVTDEHPGGEDERLMLGLRLMKQGILAAPERQAKAAALIKAGLMSKTRGRLCLTPRGALVSNAVIAEFLN